MEILPFLYLGSAYHASRKDMLDMLGITALINVSANCPNHFEGSFVYKSIPVEDNHKADISSWFNEAIEFIGEHLRAVFYLFVFTPVTLPQLPNVSAYHSCYPLSPLMAHRQTQTPGPHPPSFTSLFDSWI